MLRDIDAVIFDLDGSLVDSMWLWKEIDVEYFARYNKELPEDLQSRIEGMSFTETAQYIKEVFDFPLSIEQMKQDWNDMAIYKYKHEVPLKPGISEFLLYCKNHNIKLGIASSNSRELILGVLNAHHIKDTFDCIMSACDVNKGKPAPDIYLAVADKLEVSPHRCLVFEDIIPGIQAGKNAGMKVCAVEDDYSMTQINEKKEAADFYIKDYFDIFSK